AGPINQSRTGGRASATCLLHLYKIPLLDSPIGTPGSPAGLCQICGSLSCGRHGVRTSRAAFFCMLCDELVQVSSAGWDAWLSAGGVSTLPTGKGAVPGARSGLAPEHDGNSPVAHRMTRGLNGGRALQRRHCMAETLRSLGPAPSDSRPSAVPVAATRPAARRTWSRGAALGSCPAPAGG